MRWKTDFSSWCIKLDSDGYEERLQKEEAALWKVLGKLYPDSG